MRILVSPLVPLMGQIVAPLLEGFLTLLLAIMVRLGQPDGLALQLSEHPLKLVQRTSLHSWVHLIR